jgi:hypothetical protein
MTSVPLAEARAHIYLAMKLAARVPVGHCHHHNEWIPYSLFRYGTSFCHVRVHVCWRAAGMMQLWQLHIVFKGLELHPHYCALA